MRRYSSNAGVPALLAFCIRGKLDANSLFSKQGLIDHRQQLDARLRTAAKQLDHSKIVKSRLDVEAKKYPDRAALLGLSYLVSQTSLLFYWVYFRFDWNLVEPITYLLGYGSVWIGIAYYFRCGGEFTYDHLRSALEERKRKRLYDAAGFSVESFSALEAEVADLQRQVEQLSDL